MCQKLAILPPVAPKPKLKSKSFRIMTPPKVGFLRPNYVLRAPKKFFLVPQTTKKKCFPEKDLSSVICQNMGVRNMSNNNTINKNAILSYKSRKARKRISFCAFPGLWFESNLITKNICHILGKKPIFQW